MKRVLIESPYAANKLFTVKQHEAYAKMALLDSLMREEAPIASHLLHTMVLKDEIPEERQLGIAAGLAWLGVAEQIVFYTDLGMSPGMAECMKLCKQQNYPFTTRLIGGNVVSAIKQLRY